MRMITQSNKDELNISRILIQCSLWECRFHTCKVPRRGIVMVVVFDEIDIVRDVFVTLSYLLRFAILLLLLFLSNTDRVRGSVRVRGLVRYGTVTCCCCYCGCGDRCLGGMYSSGRESVRVRGPVQYCCLLYYTRPVCILCCCTTRSGVLLVPLLLPVPCVFFVVVLLVPSYYLFRFNYPSR